MGGFFLQWTDDSGPSCSCWLRLCLLLKVAGKLLQTHVAGPRGAPHGVLRYRGRLGGGSDVGLATEPHLHPLLPRLGAEALQRRRIVGVLVETGVHGLQIDAMAAPSQKEGRQRKEQAHANNADAEREHRDGGARPLFLCLLAPGRVWRWDGGGS